MSIVLVILGACLLGAAIIFDHFFKNRYWLVLIIIGAVIAVLGAIFLFVPVPHMAILPMIKS